VIAPDPDAIAKASTRALSTAHATQARMARATFDLYEAAVAASDHAAIDNMKPLEPARLRYALGYAAWLPPPPDRVRPLPARPRLIDRLARVAANRRYTMAGRLLFRLAPGAVVAALRARLK